MKLAHVIPLHKGGDKLTLDNYRPISLLIVMSKLLEKAMNSRIINHLDSNGLLYGKQFGFRKNRSITDAVQQFVGEVLKGFEKKNV